jgi:HlyD family secretion protein
MRFLLNSLRYFTFALAITGIILIFKVSRTIKESEPIIPDHAPNPPPAWNFTSTIAASSAVNTSQENVTIAPPQPDLINSINVKAEQTAKKNDAPKPSLTPNFTSMIAASGIVEAFQENVTIAAPQPGLIKSVNVKVGQAVKKDDVLFQLDTRELQAKQMVAEASVKQAEATIGIAQSTIEVSKISAAKAQNSFNRINRIDDKRAIILEELELKKDDNKIAIAQLATSEAQLLSSQAQKLTAEAEVRNVSLLIDRMTVKAPRDGTILQLRMRTGEWASTDAKSPSLILGRIDKLQTRIDIDEQNASRVREKQKAIAYIKGDRDHPIELTFEYVEPYVIPKTSLTGASTERVDTRVLQVIFSFSPSKGIPVYVGQQVDVFIEENKN